jgi:hypothetical protein
MLSVFQLSAFMSVNPPKIRACLFDVDGPARIHTPLIVGLLIDSEIISMEGINIYLASFGKGNVPTDIQSKMHGLIHRL